MKRSNHRMLKLGIGLALTASAITAAAAFPAFGFAASTPVTAWSKNCSTTQFTYVYGSTSTKVAVSGAKALCIDVSEHNGTIDWARVKKAGVKYAIIRCGFGGTGNRDDYQWTKNAKAARAAGVKIGVYLYSYAYNEAMAKSEAKHTLNCLEDAGLEPSDLDLPVYYDIEDLLTSHGGVPNSLMLARMASIWCNAVAAKGYNVGIYASTSWWQSKFTNKVFDTAPWSKWVAQYYSKCQWCVSATTGKQENTGSYKNYLDLWQFSSTGRFKDADTMPGNDGKVDLNYIFNTSFDSANKKVSVPGKKIVYVLNGGTNAEANTTSWPSSGTLTLAKPKRSGYTFKGWYTKKDMPSSSKVTSIKKSDISYVTLYAKWAKSTYSVSYHLNSGKNSSSNKTSYTSFDKAVKLAKPTRTGYTFKGWYTSSTFKSGTKVTSITPQEGKSIALYAKWAAKSYTITYTLDKGTMPSDPAASYKTDTATFNLPLPTRKGYAFVGWYTSKDLAGTPTMLVEKGTHGNKKLYGKWVKGGYNAKVTASSLNVRKSAGTSSARVGGLSKNEIVAISKTKSVSGAKWGYAEDHGWVMLSYTSKLK